jgi:dipeptidyl aminopeptidase/acylaminoacyl peptidase
MARHVGRWGCRSAWACVLMVALGMPVSAGGLPDSLVVDGVVLPADAVVTAVKPYLESRAAAFLGWRADLDHALIATRFGEAPELHLVARAGGDRRQITFEREPITQAQVSPTDRDLIVYLRDVGGGEFYQLYRLDLADGRTTLLSDGASRNTAPAWSRDGARIAYSSTRRNGADTDLYLIDPRPKSSDRLLAALDGGGWRALDWSPDGRHLLVQNYLSAEDSRLYLMDAETGAKRQVTPTGPGKASWLYAIFDKTGEGAYVATDLGSEFRRLGRLDFASGRLTPLGPKIDWDVEQIVLSHDGARLAYTTNENGVSVLHLLELATDKPVALPPIPVGVSGQIAFSHRDRRLGFSLSSARSPSDVYAIDLDDMKLERWTESETGGLPVERFVEPELVAIESFDGVKIGGILYRPDPARFPGRRPLVVNIHGGPESQARPIFRGRDNYLVNEMGVALFFPNIRGSDGYGKTFLALDNGMKREDSVRDIGAFLEHLKRDPRIDGERIAVVGGSYGGYVVAASLERYGPALRCGIDIVGISNFVTFLKNTQDYRRDLRRVEYGDEREPDMAAFLERISPTNNAARIRQPVFLVAGANDPRVPPSEAERMSDVIRRNGGQTWLMIAKDEGHGFVKKRNADALFLSSVAFLQKYLID